MARAKIGDDIEFGSDSFLDVVANIVGILIILIVVAGVKANGAPVSTTKVADYISKHQPPRAVVTAVVSPPVLATPSPPRVSPLIGKIAALRADLTALNAESRETAALAEEAARHEQQLGGQLMRLKGRLNSEAAAVKERDHLLASAQSQLTEKKTALQQLEVDVQQLEKDKPAVKTLKHKLTPLSLDIHGKEVHFRLMHGRVAYLPIEELMERLQPQIRRQRDRLLREGTQSGQVGPVAGFNLDYIVEVKQISMVDELRRGGSMTIGVSGWRLVAEPDLEQESVEQALTRGSDFLRAIHGADPESTITFWVYPDSFGAYRRLQEFAHNENFTVAARPIPFGLPIAGSPQGSRSSGQ